MHVKNNQLRKAGIPLSMQYLAAEHEKHAKQGSKQMIYYIHCLPGHSNL